MFKWSLFKNGVMRPMERNSIEVYRKKNVILKYFQPQNTTSEAKEIVRSILDNILNDSMNDSTGIAFDFVNEIVNS